MPANCTLGNMLNMYIEEVIFLKGKIPEVEIVLRPLLWRSTHDFPVSTLISSGDTIFMGTFEGKPSNPLEASMARVFLSTHLICWGRHTAIDRHELQICLPSDRLRSDGMVNLPQTSHNEELWRSQITCPHISLRYVPDIVLSQIMHLIFMPSG